MENLEVITMKINPEQYFRTCEGKHLKSIIELAEYLKTCDTNSFYYHVNEKKNDFANWIEGVFQEHDLSLRLRQKSDINSFKIILEDYLKKKENPIGVVISSDSMKINVVKSEPVNVDVAKINEKINVVKSEPVNVDVAKINEKINEKINVVKSESVKVDVEKIDVAKSELKIDNTQQNIMSVKEKRFKEFTDEELEKFSQFSRHATESKDENVINNVSIIQAKISELKTMITNLRKEQKNPIIPDLLLRSLNSKIAFYTLTCNKSDYENILREMDEVEKEIDFCSNEKVVNIAADLRVELEKSI